MVGIPETCTEICVLLSCFAASWLSVWSLPELVWRLGEVIIHSAGLRALCTKPQGLGRSVTAVLFAKELIKPYLTHLLCTFTFCNDRDCRTLEPLARPLRLRTSVKPCFRANPQSPPEHRLGDAEDKFEVSIDCCILNLILIRWIGCEQYASPDQCYFATFAVPPMPLHDTLNFFCFSLKVLVLYHI